MPSPPANTAYAEISKTLKSYRFFRIGARIVNAISDKLPIALIPILLIKLLSYVLPVEYRGILQAAFLAAGLAAAFVAIFKKPYSLLDSAIDADKQFNLKEQVSTAIELFAKSSKVALYEKLSQKAIRKSRDIRPKAGFLLNFNFAMKTNLAILFLLAVLYFVPSHMDKIVWQRLELKDEKSAVAERIKDIKKEVTALKLNKKDEKQLLNKLKKILLDIKTADSRESLIAKLNKHQEKLKQDLESSSNTAGAKLENLASNLNENNELKGLSKALKDSDKAGIKRSLKELEEKLKQGGLSKQELASLSQALSEGANTAAQLGDNNAAQALSALASAINDNQAQETSSAVNKLGEAANQLVDAKNLENAQSSAIAQLDGQKASIANASKGQSGKSGGQTAMAGSKGKGSGGSQGSNNNSAAGKSGGAGQGTIGAKFKSDGGTGGSNNLGLKDADKTNNFANETSVFAPSSYLKNKGEKLHLTGIKQQGETTQGLGKPGAGLNTGAVLPYANVYFDYMQYTAESIRRGEIPKDFEQLVLQYFSSINPDKQ